jgi:hypothetical protein
VPFDPGLRDVLRAAFSRARDDERFVEPSDLIG